LVIPIDSVRELRYSDLGGGAAKGTFFGVLAGAAAGPLFGLQMPDVGGGYHRMTLLQGAMLGGAIGALAGLAAGNQVTCEFRRDTTARRHTTIQ
jgi:gas vesicle protein